MAAKENGHEDLAHAQNELYSYDSFSGNSKPSGHRFLWWCAGAHQKLLKKFPSEYSKYAGLGGVILATFILASLSGGYAVHSVFGNGLWTFLFAIIWGLIIFNFDRFLVSTMRKYGVSRRKQLWMAAPRIALALLIGVTIARPLELKIFEKEIDVKVTENLHKKMQLNDSLLAKEYTQLLNAAETERSGYNNRKLAIEDSLHQMRNDYIKEADGTGGSRQRGIDQLTRLKYEAYNLALLGFKPELNALDKKMKLFDSTIAATHAEKEQKRKAYETSIHVNVGFLERNKALADLSDEESSVFWSNLLIALLIILIETGPVLSKLIMPVGPYDIALAKEELVQMASDENDIRKDKEVLYEKKKVFYQKQKETSDQLVEKLTRLQQKNIDRELDKWERGEWEPGDHRVSMDEVMRKIKSQYQYKEEDLL